jgi:hypothetical protein
MEPSSKVSADYNGLREGGETRLMTLKSEDFATNFHDKKIH